MTRIVSVAFAAVVSKRGAVRHGGGEGAQLPGEGGVALQSSSGPRRSAADSADATVPFCVITRRPSCASTKLFSQSWPASPMTCTSALKSPSR